MKYRSVVVTRKGSPEVLEVVEKELDSPKAGEVRIKILATCVGQTDISYRYGYSPLNPKIPFVPGYEMVGVIDALGEGVAGFRVGDRVAALTNTGGYAEYITLAQEHLVTVPTSLDPGEVAILVLNYVTAYQMLHRAAKVKSGDIALIVGASGGVGTALLQLGKLAGLKMYGIASKSKHQILVENGATPIDYHTQDFQAVIRQAEPNGLDVVFDGIGGDYADKSFALLHKGGKLLEYAPARGLGPTLAGLGKILLMNLLPNGKSVSFYGISTVYATNKQPIKEDLSILLKLLESGKIKPVIAEKLPLLEARRANELLESGKVTGTIVLLAPELLSA